MNEKIVEELQALLASEGWAIFKSLVAEMYGEEQVMAELYNRANKTVDYDSLGRQTAVMMATIAAVRNILSLPGEKIAALEGEKA